jgi:hypothetical protein
MGRTAAPHKKQMVVEGSSDFGFWQTHARKRSWEIVDAQGVANLTECMKSLPAALKGHACAVADEDFRRYLPIDPFSETGDVFFYDEGFFETLLINSRALRKVLTMYGDPAKILAFEAKHACTVLTYLRDLCEPISKLRILSVIHDWRIPFEKQFSLYKYLNERTWTVDIEALHIDIAQRISKPKQSIEDEASTLKKLGAYSLVHGHDATKAIAIGLRCVLGTCGAMSHTKVEQFLQLAYEAETLRMKKITSQICRWAAPTPLL